MSIGGVSDFIWFNTYFRSCCVNKLDLIFTETTKRPRRTLLISLFLFFKTFTTDDNLITVNRIFYFRCSVQSEKTQQKSKHNSFPLEFDKQFQSYLGLRTSGESCLCCNHICNAVAWESPSPIQKTAFRYNHFDEVNIGTRTQTLSALPRLT